MELSQIRIFLAVAEKHSFTKAARALYISHSTTSRAVSALEEELGVVLIDRRENRVLGLTAAGKVLYTYGPRLLAGAEELEKAVKSAG